MENIKKIILFVHHGKGFGGAPLSLLYLIKGLDKTKYKPIVVFLHDSSVVALYKENDIEIIGPLAIMDFSHTVIYHYKWYHIHHMIKALKDTIKTLFFVAPKILKQYRPAIVHLNTSSLMGWAIAAKKLGIPVVWHVREPLANGYIGLRKMIIKKLISYYANSIIPISNNDAKPWLLHKKTQVIYNPVPESIFNATVQSEPFLTCYNLSNKTPKILFLGGISFEKGTHVILDVFKKVRLLLPQAQLLIAGNSEIMVPHNIYKKIKGYCTPSVYYRERVFRDIASLGTSVILLGSINTVPEAMAASTIVVFPSTVGHFARPIIEAGFMKKPVIASAYEPLDEIVVHKKTGFLIDPYVTSEWVETIYLLLTDNSLAKKVGDEAYIFCSQRFSTELHVAKVEKEYQKNLSMDFNIKNSCSLPF